jgi:hypothetical protein
VTAVFDAFAARPHRKAARPATPPPAAEVPPGVTVPSFPPIRAGCGARHRLRRALRHGPGPLTAGLLATAAALAAGPPHAPAAPHPVPHCGVAR